MEILKRISTVYDARYTSNAAIVVLEDHVQFIKNQSSDTLPVTENLAGKWAGDFYGLLGELGIKENMRYITMRINDLTSPDEDFSQITNVLIPKETTVELVFASIKTEKEKLKNKTLLESISSLVGLSFFKVLLESRLP